MIKIFYNNYQHETCPYHRLVLVSTEKYGFVREKYRFVWGVTTGRVLV